MRRRRLAFIAADITIGRMGKARRVFTDEERRAGKQPCITNVFQPDKIHARNQRQKKRHLTQAISGEMDRGDPDGDLPHAATPAERRRNLSKKGRKQKFHNRHDQRKAALKGTNTVEGEETEPKLLVETARRTDHSQNDKMRDGVELYDKRMKEWELNKP